jgi:hypothetical protein
MILPDVATRPAQGVQFPAFQVHLDVGDWAGDVLVVTQKIVSKAEGRLVPVDPDDVLEVSGRRSARDPLGDVGSDLVGCLIEALCDVCGIVVREQRRDIWRTNRFTSVSFSLSPRLLARSTPNRSRKRRR